MTSIQPTGTHACDIVIPLSNLYPSNEHQIHPTLDPKAHQKWKVATNCHNDILSENQQATARSREQEDLSSVLSQRRMTQKDTL